MSVSISPQLVVRHLAKADPALAKVITSAGPLTLKPRRRPVFEGLLKSIVYQQLSGKAAATIHGRLLALLPARTADQPAAILDLPDEVLRSAGLSRGKLLAIQDLAQRTVGGQVPTRRQLARLGDEAIIEALIPIRGVGRWTAEMILIFWLGRLDVLPVSDLGVRRGFSVIHGQSDLPSAEELLQYGERWRPYRSAAAWYLWRAVELAAKQAPGGSW